jgi:hypothetical protein
VRRLADAKHRFFDERHLARQLGAMRVFGFVVLGLVFLAIVVVGFGVHENNFEAWLQPRDG